MKYATIVADPPWRTQRPAGWHTTLEKIPLTYPTMSAEEIASLPVATLAADDAHLYLWTINAYVESAYAVVKAWRFRPVTLLTWCKKPHGIGPGGTYAHTTEFIVLAKRGALAAHRRVETTWWLWPRGAHSAKPEAFLDMVETVSPGPYLELFARRNRLGWHTWGHEALNHVDLGGA